MIKIKTSLLDKEWHQEDAVYSRHSLHILGYVSVYTKALQTLLNVFK